MNSDPEISSPAQHADTARLCGPWVCPYPNGADHHAGDRWTCPDCGTHYVLSRPKHMRWWRNWCAPQGHWRLSWRRHIDGDAGA